VRQWLRVANGQPLRSAASPHTEAVGISVADIEAATYWLGLIHWAKIIGAFLVAIGVAAEFLGDFIAKPYEDAVEAARKAEVTKLTAETVRLSAEAETARAAIADANARALEAQLALEKLKTPRDLKPEQQERVTSAAQAFAGQRYQAAISQGADDGPSFWKTLHLALKNAGWEYIPPSGPWVGDPPASIPIAAVPGVAIFVDRSKLQELEPAVLALGNALKAGGIRVIANVSGYDSADEMQQRTIQIVIGARAQP
jgi:hypothetical protein